MGSKPIQKSIFVDLLCKIWHKGLSPKNVIAGFRSTGIYPVNREKFPIDRFNARLLKRYNIWVELGKPEELATSVNTPKKISHQ